MKIKINIMFILIYGKMTNNILNTSLTKQKINKIISYLKKHFVFKQTNIHFKIFYKDNKKYKISYDGKHIYEIIKTREIYKGKNFMLVNATKKQLPIWDFECFYDCDKIEIRFCEGFICDKFKIVFSSIINENNETYNELRFYIKEIDENLIKIFKGIKINIDNKIKLSDKNEYFIV